MYQMICPVLEGLCGVEGGDASDGAGTGTEIDVYGRTLRRELSQAEADGSAFVPFAGALDDILCVHADRVVGNDNSVRYRGLSMQVPPDRHRRH